mmetsp:Transcript_6125/g.7048  ORF Transcript_6125/g.7048 Transcript_6125/m.7048 type:complete len:641 (-) Transcript_6125:1264-3186(-)
MGNEDSTLAHLADSESQKRNMEVRNTETGSPPPRIPTTMSPSHSPMVAMYEKNGTSKLAARSTSSNKQVTNMNSKTFTKGTSKTGRSRRPSLRSPATKRELKIPMGQLKRTKSNTGEEFFRDEKPAVEDFEIESLSAKLRSRRVSITSDDEDDGQIASIVAKTAAHMANSFKSGNLVMKSGTPAKMKKDTTSSSKNAGVASSLLSKNKTRAGVGSTSQKQGRENSKAKTTANKEKKSSALSGGPGWSIKQDNRLKELIEKHGTDWKSIQKGMPGRSQEQCINRWNKVLKPGLRKGTWTPEEDARLIKLVHELEKRNWGDVAALIKGRTAKQCRERWCYNLDPSINKNLWTPEEDQLLIKSQSELGNRWAHIASLLPGRTENAVKTRFKSIMRAKKREWLPEEDATIIKMHKEVGSRWDAIAAKLPNRTKNAVKTRFRLLGKGMATKQPEIGSPNQVLRSNKLKNVSLAELTKRVAAAHKERTQKESKDDATECKDAGGSQDYAGDVSIVPPVNEAFSSFHPNNDMAIPNMNMDFFHPNSSIYDTFSSQPFQNQDSRSRNLPIHAGLASTALSQDNWAANAVHTIPGSSRNTSGVYNMDETVRDDFLTMATAQEEDELMDFFDMWDQGGSGQHKKSVNTKA